MSLNEMYFNDTPPLHVIYVLKVGQLSDGTYIYHLLLSDNPEDTWAEFWEQKPACNCGDLTPSDDMYSHIKEVRLPIPLDLAQNNCCFSMQDCRDRCIALACENLDLAEEYPENGRIVIQFGDNIENVDKMFARRDFVTYFIEK